MAGNQASASGPADSQAAGQADEQIARGAALRPIDEVAGEIDLLPDEIESHGRSVAKVSVSAADRLADRPNGRYVHVTSMTPLPTWEDPATTAIALADALQALGKRSACCLQQPSLGTVLAGEQIGAGSGRFQIVPRDRFGLHLTGDLHAVTSAHALLSSATDAMLVRAGPEGLDTRRVVWRRCQEVIDTALRQTVVGLGGGGVPRESGFDLTPNSEVMAVLTLSSSLADLRERLGRIVVGYSHHDLPVFANSLKVDGAMAALLRDALRPNLMQTLAGTPVFVHGSTAIELSHGGGSVLSDQIALRCCDYVVTTSAGGAELGLEKFCDIKCRASGLAPDAVVLIATVRAVKFHSGRYRSPDDPRLAEASVQAVREGAANVAKHLENIRYFGLPCVVMIARSDADTDEELEVLSSVASVSGASAVVIGGYGEATTGDGNERGETDTSELARAVTAACEEGATKFSYLYEATWPIAKKIETIATTLYNAGRVEYSARASAAMERYTQLGWQNLSLCMAKTVHSLSHDPDLLGRPYDFVLPVEDVRVAAGAGFLIVQLGRVQPMPAPARRIRAAAMDLTEDAEVGGLFD